jgi:hypothetical protein
VTSQSPCQPPKKPPINLGKGLFDQFTRSVLTSFRDCLLFPVPIGVEPQVVEPPQLTEVNTPAYQSRLATQNVAVALGLADGLFGIQFGGEDALARFFVRNPATKDSLSSTHCGQPVLWLRCRTAHRVSLRLPSINVLMRGHVLIVNRSGPERADFILNRAAPLMVNPESMDWGDHDSGLVDCWLTRLSHGDFFRQGTQGQIIPNRRAWQLYLTRQLRPRLAYEVGEGQFFEPLPGAAGWRPVPEDELRLRLRDLIAMAPIDAPKAKARLSDEWLAQLCRKSKASLARHLPIMEIRLRVFTARCLVKSTGAAVTNAELFTAFEQDARQTGQPLLSSHKFKVLLGRILRSEPWGVCYSKSIKGKTGQQNGWRGVRLKDPSVILTATGGADGAGGVKIPGDIQ